MAHPLRKVIGVLGLLLGVLAIGLILAWLMGAFHEAREPGPPEVAIPRAAADAPVVQAEAVEVPLTETAVGTIDPVQRVGVGSRLLARVVAMHVEKAGQRVEQHDVLVELDDTDLQAQVQQAQAALDAAQAEQAQAALELSRTEELHARRVEPEAAVDAARTHVATAEAAVRRAEQSLAFARSQLEHARIEAPIGGVVVDKHVEQGDLVRPGQVLVTLYDPGRMQLVARVRERLAMDLERGEEVDVSIPALDLACHGTIDQIVPQAEAASRVFEVRVTGPCPPGIYAGMFARLHVPVGTRREVHVPAAAVRRVGQMEMAFVVDEDRRVLRRFVQTRRIDAKTLEVLTGLEAGETILASAADAP